MYGIQTWSGADVALYEFENDVKMYGIQTRRLHRQWKQRFENDVKCMVFKQTLAGNKLHNRLRMM